MARISDLLLRQGDVLANRHLARGQMWGGVASTLGQIPAGVRQRRAEDEDRQQRGQLFDARLRTEGLQQQDYEGRIADRDRAALDEQTARELAAKAHQVESWLADVAAAPDLETQRSAYEAGRAQLVQSGVLTEQDAPAMWPGQSWVKSRMSMLLPAKERFAALFPEPEKPQSMMNLGALGVFDPNTRQIIEGTAAPPEPEGTVTINTVDERGHPVTRVLPKSQAVGQTFQQYREPKTPAAPSGQEWVMRNGTPTPIARGTAQAGDMPYDPVAARQSNALPEGSKEARETTQTALELASRLEQHPGFSMAYGNISSRFTGISQDAQDAAAIRDQLVAYLALPNLGALKGPMSDKDVVFVKQMATRLSNPRISDAEARQAIAEAKAFLQTRLAGAEEDGPTRGADPLGLRGGGGGADPLGIR